jgi:hypothetical protein
MQYQMSTLSGWRRRRPPYATHSMSLTVSRCIVNIWNEKEFPHILFHGVC